MYKYKYAHSGYKKSLSILEDLFWKINPIKVLLWLILPEDLLPEINGRIKLVRTYHRQLSCMSEFVIKSVHKLVIVSAQCRDICHD